MRPPISRVLSGAADAIGSELAPLLRGDAAASGHASIIRLLMLAAAQEADRVPDTLMAEIAAMRLLFDGAAETPLSDELRLRLREAARTAAPSGFTVTALNDLAASMKAVLVELHAEVEEIPTPWARSVEAQVWDILRMGAERRDLQLPGM